MSYRRLGADREGGDDRVSPVGLASWRSRSVNASSTSGASKARFRRPTVTWVRTPACSRRRTPWLVAWKLRPMRSAAPDTVRTGAPGSATISSSVAEPARMRPSDRRQSSWTLRMRASNASASSTARRQAAATSLPRR